ncbi:LYSM3 protein, partial [Polyodon spathula]|nr:lysM and putative peptidoglycan-binding domain-containing protein 3-like [Polyodon spathula]XP_041101066.1 lysM and putative peptidoglycan-binding domain-containing protein 3-like [Polyodon spathula]XP_041101076.1 lysM and putative peptidoglycan-binding domain-containing protein 3-like [Polyodon spathula]XP_041101085.1 lysM and putative peptidoglycan-binding domain-containing protein 3-like [Polyodon spathula]MBN3285436.1 LYSM3 protein [Polyodon spathula]
MTGKSQQSGYQPATGVQSANGGRAYVFANNLNLENDFSEDDGDCYELRSRGKEKACRSTSRDRSNDIVYLVRDIKEGDTMNAIALQYFCSVADIKRANNLLNEQDFFALRSIKIPVKKFSVLTETHSPSVLKQLTPADGSTPETKEAEAALGSSSSTESVGNYLQEVDKDIEQLVKSSDSSRGSLNEVVSFFSSPRQLGVAERRVSVRKDPYYGADWGMRWWMAVAIMLVVGIITPVFYLLYYEVLMKADISHHLTSESLGSVSMIPTQHPELLNIKSGEAVPGEVHEHFNLNNPVPSLHRDDT